MHTIHIRIHPVHTLIHICNKDNVINTSRITTCGLHTQHVPLYPLQVVRTMQFAAVSPPIEQWTMQELQAAVLMTAGPFTTCHYVQRSAPRVQQLHAHQHVTLAMQQLQAQRLGKLEELKSNQWVFHKLPPTESNKCALEQALKPDYTFADYRHQFTNTAGSPFTPRQYNGLLALSP